MRGFMWGVKSGFNSFLLSDGNGLDENNQLFFLRKTYEFCEKIGSDFNLRKNFSEKEYVPMWTMSASVFLLESIGLMFDAGGRFDRDCLLSGEIVGRSLVLNHLLDGMPLSTINIIEELGVNLIR